MSQQWKGGSPRRFSGGRIHNHPQDSLGLLMRQHLPSTRLSGIKTYTHQPTKQQTFIPGMKVFPQLSLKQTYEVPGKGKLVTRLPEQKQRIRPQRIHIDGGKQTNDQLKWKGIKSFQQANKSRNIQYLVQNQFCRKIIVDNLDKKRNNINISALGDKSYKYPQYAPNFYKSGGLIPGSTNSYIGKKSDVDKKITGVLTKPNWDVKVKMQEAAQQQKILNSVDQWEQTILKEANPNWKDPDTFFQRQQAKNVVKDPKKGGKK